ncbi:MAG: rhomboid family intramembrane serine protease [Defluviitaleaceae bacterium]|nr:rhomboid family intramembrane serine protease [Defluviitaleaceae bacterium]
MNPLKRIHYNAPVTLTFALISAGTLILAHFTDGASDRLLFMVYRSSWTDPLAYLRIFTHAIGHADLTHFLSNFIIILLVGPMLEEKYGPKLIIIIMVITAFVTGVLWIIMSPYSKLGASGIVFMLILLSSFANMQKGRIPLTLILAVVIYLGQEVMSFATMDGSSNIAYMSHIAGGICGALFGFMANSRDGYR